MFEVITTAYTEIREDKKLYEKNKLYSWKQLAHISYHGYRAMILTGVPCPTRDCLNFLHAAWKHAG